MTRYLAILIVLATGLVGTPRAWGQKEAKQARKEERKARRLDLRFQKERFIVMNLGLIYKQAQDTRMAQNIYRGPGVFFYGGYRSDTPKGIHQVGAKAQISLLSPQHDESSVLNPRFTFQYLYMGKLSGDLERGQWYIGGSLDGLFAYRISNELSNSGFNWDGIGSLSAAGGWFKNMKLLKRDMQLRGIVSLSLLSYVNRFPEYSVSSGGVSETISVLGKFSRMISQWTLDWKLGRRSENLLQLGYTWDLYLYPETEIHKLRIAEHQLTIGLLVKL